MDKFRNTILAMSMICLGLPMFTSCEEDEVQEWELLKFSDWSSGSDYLTYSVGEGPTYNIRTNGKWEVSSDADWVNFSQTSGYGDATITTTLDKNTLTNDRYAKIWIRGGEFNESSNIAGLYNHSENSHSSYSLTQKSYPYYVSSYVSKNIYKPVATRTYNEGNSTYLYKGDIEFDIVNKGDIDLSLDSGVIEIGIGTGWWYGTNLEKIILDFKPVWGKNKVSFSAIYNEGYSYINEISLRFNVSDGELTYPVGTYKEYNTVFNY